MAERCSDCGCKSLNQCRDCAIRDDAKLRMQADRIVKLEAVVAAQASVIAEADRVRRLATSISWLNLPRYDAARANLERELREEGR